MGEKKLENNKVSTFFDNLMTIKEFCEASRGNIKPQTVHKWIRQGMPTAEPKMGGKIWLDPEVVRDWHQRRQ